MVRELIFGSMLAVLLATQGGMPSRHAFADSLLADNEESDDSGSGRQSGASQSNGPPPRTCEVQTAPVAKSVCATKMAIFQVCTGEQPEFKKCI